MSNKYYDIVERLAEKNKKPTLKITNDLTVTINTSVVAGIALHKLNNAGDAIDLDLINTALDILVGKEDAEKIRRLELTIGALMYLLEAITAAFANEDIESPSKSRKRKKAD